jgi:hypothetical protein
MSKRVELPLRLTEPPTIHSTDSSNSTVPVVGVAGGGTMTINPGIAANSLRKTKDATRGNQASAGSEAAGVSTDMAIHCCFAGAGAGAVAQPLRARPSPTPKAQRRNPESRKRSRSMKTFCARAGEGFVLKLRATGDCGSAALTGPDKTPKLHQNFDGKDSPAARDGFERHCVDR